MVWYEKFMSKKFAVAIGSIIAIVFGVPEEYVTPILTTALGYIATQGIIDYKKNES